MPTRRDLLRTSGLALAGGLAGCSFLGEQSQETVTPAAVPTVADQHTPPPEPTPSRELSVAHWLTRTNERAGYEALVAGFTEQFPDVRVRPPSGSGISLTESGLEQRISRGYPPGIWQSEPGGGLLNLAGDRLLVDISESVWSGTAMQVGFPPEVRGLANPTGPFVAVPWYGERLNNLFYNPEVVERAGVDPASLDDPRDLPAMLSTIAAETDATPLAQTTETPWQVGAMFEAVLLGLTDPGRFSAFVDGEIDYDLSVTTREAFELVADLQTHFPADAGDIGWETAVDRVIRGDAAMTICGDWAVSGPAADYGFGPRAGRDRASTWAHTPVPGTMGSYQFTADAFVAPANNPMPELSTQWLAYCASPEGQERFSERAGTIPLRSDADESALSPFMRQQYTVYRAARARLPSITHGLVLSPAAYTEYLTSLFQFVNDWNARLAADRVVSVVT